MKNSVLPPISIISLVLTYSSHFIPFFVSGGLTNREIMLVSFFLSILFLTIFVFSVQNRVNELKYECMYLENKLEVTTLKLELLSNEAERLQASISKHEQQEHQKQTGDQAEY